MTDNGLARELDLVQRLARADHQRDTLRAALDGRDNLIRLVLMRHHESEADIETCDVCRAARAALATAKETPPADCGATHPEHPGTHCRRKSGHGGDHATARYDVQWSAKEAGG